MKNYQIRICAGFLFLILFFISLQNTVHAQGCSDAGFCTLSSFKPVSLTDSSMNQVKLGISTGRGSHSISVFNTYVEYNRQLSGKTSLDAKLVFSSQTGNGISSSGLSDLYLNSNFTISENTVFTVGTKIPFSNGNTAGLPMDYQSSLGTWDLISGISFQYQKAKFAVALQQPLSQNKNSFFSTSYPSTSPLSKIQSTNKYKRAGDILFRAAYPFSVSKKFMATASLLPIYHLSDDKYTDMSGTEKTIAGSQGLTLNGNIFLNYAVNNSSNFNLSLGAPFVTRKARPDGLTRKYVATLEYALRF